MAFFEIRVWNQEGVGYDSRLFNIDNICYVTIGAIKNVPVVFLAIANNPEPRQYGFKKVEDAVAFYDKVSDICKNNKADVVTIYDSMMTKEHFPSETDYASEEAIQALTPVPIYLSPR